MAFDLDLLDKTVCRGVSRAADAVLGWPRGTSSHDGDMLTYAFGVAGVD